jgi:zinc protease
VILHPAFPESDFRRLQKQRIAAIQREKVTPVPMALRVFPGLLYGPQHAYGNPLTGSGTEASVSKLTREDLVKFHDTWFKPNDATLIVVGDITLAELTPKLEKLLDGWKSGQTPKKNIGTVEYQPKPVVYILDRPGALQSVILAGEIAPPKSNPDEIALEAMNDILGGNFGARINMNLREDKHWSYGVRSVLQPAVGQRPYLSISPVQTDKTKEALTELVKEYKGIVGDKPITEVELKDEQDNATLGLPGSFESVQQLSGAYSRILQYKLPEDYYNTYTEKAMAVTPASANQVAEKYIQPGHLIWMVVGDMSKVEAGIVELNLGEIHKIDADGNPVK